MSDPFIGEIKMFAGNFAPQGYAFCDGQLLPINQHQALFSLLGTTYGGDGRTTFALPDLRGRVPVHPGQGAGLIQRQLGERGGQENVALSESQLAAHTHAAFGTQEEANSKSPGNALLATTQGNRKIYDSTGKANAALDSGTVGSSGGGQEHDNMQPYLGIHFIIALEGIFPSRS
jgi:microcystin-dependent protein